MYTTCLFCHASLGANEVIESFPVGRRLAFDAAQGRLWVVCRKCERWNLTPMEERWEAVEQCERLFSSTRLRTSTDNIGLARLREGLELVRVGKPQRPEMAAWRYGDQFGRRRRKYVAYSVGAGVIVAGVILGGPLLGIGSVAGGGWGLFQGANALIKAASDRVVRTRVAVPGFDRPAIIRGKDVGKIVLGSDDEGLTLRLPYNAAGGASESPSEVIVRGDDAFRVAGNLLPAVNAKGGKQIEIDAAVQYLETTPDARSLFATSAGHAITARLANPKKKKAKKKNTMKLAENEVFLDRIPSAMLLAMEMAAHEDIERRAMEGELAILEAAWRQAEEIAAIADNLLMPRSVEGEVDNLRADFEERESKS